MRKSVWSQTNTKTQISVDIAQTKTGVSLINYNNTQYVGFVMVDVTVFACIPESPPLQGPKKNNTLCKYINPVLPYERNWGGGMPTKIDLVFVES